jgi:endonuclease/exonuclease/phosphatase (EEP) superfamily protein YafD
MDSPTLKFRDSVRRQSAARLLADVAMLCLLGGLAALSVAGIASAWAPQMETFGNLHGYLGAGGFLAVMLALLVRVPRWCALAAFVAAANVATIVYRIAPAESCPIQMAATGVNAVRVLTHNILWDNRDLGTVERMLRGARPDVIVLQEIQPWHLPLFARLADAYPHQSICPDVEHCGIVILSRYPLESRKSVNDRFGEVIALDNVVSVGGRKLVLLGAHIVRPFRGRTQRAQFERLFAAVSKLPPNAIVAGDFNSVPWSANMARYSAGAGVCAANGSEATWPIWLGPAGIPIDHIFLKPGLRLLSIATVGGSGSDHKALMATIGLR